MNIMYTYHICIIYYERMSEIYMGFISLSYVNGFSNQYSEIKFPDFLSALGQNLTSNLTFRSNFKSSFDLKRTRNLGILFQNINY